MKQVGYSLIDKNKKEVQHWGEYGSMTNLPETVWLPNGDIVHAPTLYGELGEYQLVKRYIDNNPPSEFFSPIEIVEIFKDGDILLTYYYGNRPNVTPKTVTPLQFRKALNQLGLRKLVDDYVKTLDQDAQDSWEYATIVERDNPLLNAASVFLKKNSDDVDDIFRLASTL